MDDPRLDIQIGQTASRSLTVTPEMIESYARKPHARIMHTPGHSEGTVAVIVETDAGVVAVTGDGIQSAQVAMSKTNALVFWSEADAARSIERVLETTDTVHQGHDMPFRMRKDGTAEYLVPKRITLTGLTLEEPGVTLDPTPRAPFVMPGIKGQTLERLD